jgi:hypothetical protein
MVKWDLCTFWKIIVYFGGAESGLIVLLEYARTGTTSLIHTSHHACCVGIVDPHDSLELANWFSQDASNYTWGGQTRGDQKC